MTLCSIGVIARHYGVSPSTIRRWVEKGVIQTEGRTFGGHRRFREPAVQSAETAGRKIVGYARVSSHDQKSDLLRQADRLRDAGCDEVISDIGSGLNCRKPGLRRLLRMLLDNRIEKLLVLHEDRLLRFGVPLVRFLCGRVNTEFLVVEAVTPVSFEAELARDVVTLMTVFCARLYGRRGRRKGVPRNAEASG